MPTRQLPRIGLDARSDEDLLGILHRSHGRYEGNALEDFRRYGSVQFVGSDGDGFPVQITVRRA